MSESAFNFKGAPGTPGLPRQWAKNLATAVGAKAVFGNKLSGGVSAKEHSALMRQQTAHNIDTAIVKHVLGETASDAAHQRTLADREHGFNLINQNTPEGHVASSISAGGVSARFNKVKQPKQDSTFTQPSSPSVDLTDIGSGPKGPQWRAR